MASRFHGRVLWPGDYNAAININPDVTLEGRALTTTGAISVNKITANIPTGCGRAVLTGPAAPDLLSTACYAIFSSSGDVTGDAATTVTGDIGSNFGSVAGATIFSMTLYDKYINRQTEQVYKDISVLGQDAFLPKNFPDIEKVLIETFDRVSYNLDIIHSELKNINYLFPTEFDIIFSDQ